MPEAEQFSPEEVLEKVRTLEARLAAHTTASRRSRAEVEAQRAEAEHRARASEARFRLLAEHLQDAVLLHDADGRCRYASPSAGRILGVPPHILEGYAVARLVHPEDRDRFQRTVCEPALRGDTVAQVHIRVPQGPHSVRDLEVYATPVDEASGAGAQVVTTWRDVTEQRRTEAELRAAKEKAEEMARLKSAFLANMSHEIRTPLTSIIGFAEVLTSELPSEYHEFIHLIGTSGKRLLQTLNSVLDLAQLEARSMTLMPEEVAPGPVVADAVLLLESMARDRGLDLQFVDETDESVTASVDVSCLSRIVVNLATNAIKFTDTGRVTVSLRSDDRMLVLCVEDTGIGIDPAFVPYLFDEFRQESTGVRRSYEGSGLGLYITRRLCELMGGTIDVQSVQGEGSTFTVTLPRSGHYQGDTMESSAESYTGPARLLVVEDNPETCSLLRHLLGKRYAPRIVSTVEDALALIRTEPFDLALIDINLGQPQSGIDLCHAIRNEPGVHVLRMIALTAYALPGDRERLLAEGFDGYLGKPFTRDQLYTLIEEHVA